MCIRDRYQRRVRGPKPSIMLSIVRSSRSPQARNILIAPVAKCHCEPSLVDQFLEKARQAASQFEDALEDLLQPQDENQPELMPIPIPIPLPEHEHHNEPWRRHQHNR
eukprot:TRINITY_DN6385_c0_g1_i1.p3 TRINITY_DN6385_c0_g1~~TRINITY_DN6385_c0_g1_i1.p3  ORF type:complete len:108 (+),score=17.22 TRINITY_DN6385_c0_g1_i1:136-459(+)